MKTQNYNNDNNCLLPGIIDFNKKYQEMYLNYKLYIRVLFYTKNCFFFLFTCFRSKVNLSKHFNYLK